MKNKKAQVWVETVIYTLIGLVLIGMVLAFATPYIQKQRDKTLIERTAAALHEVDNSVENVKRAGIGNVRKIDFLIGEGNMEIQGDQNKIVFEITESSYPYSEPGISVNISGTNMKSKTEKKGKKFKITLTLDYTDKLNITFKKKDEKHTLDQSPTPYNILIENRGREPTLIPCTTPIPPATDSCEPYTCVNNFCTPKLTNIDFYTS